MARDAFDGWTDRADDAYKQYLRDCGAAFSKAADAIGKGSDGDWVQRATHYNRAAVGLAFDMATGWMDFTTQMAGVPWAGAPGASSVKRTKKK